ncbi:MAG: disulfide bond formation protein B [Gammaproteobacteria bacterium]|jgi:protein dithiol:quinone oxidoreductase|nr:disulfide bond formation protein B [Gammaproteobacteria bacterium]
MNFLNNKYLNIRLIYLYIFLICASLLGIALYMENVMGLEPCPLCMTQRLFFAMTGIIALIAFIHNPKELGRSVYGFICAAFSFGGGGFAIRQIYLQHLPEDQVPACGPSLGYMIEVFPMSEVITAMLSGDGNCAEVVWQDPVIGMSIPEWSLLGFLMLGCLCVFQALRNSQP